MYFESYGSIFSPQFPVIGNQLSVTAGSQSNPGVGNLTIYGGPQGILLNNTTVDYLATLNVVMTDFNCIPYQPYIFDASGYHYRLTGYSENSNDNQLPGYFPTNEFSAIANRNQVWAYPSPAVSAIQFSGFDAPCNLEIFSMNGQSVCSVANYVHDEAVNVEFLESGCYFACLTSATLNRRVKFIKQ